MLYNLHGQYFSWPGSDYPYSSRVNGLDTDLKKQIGCFTGQCAPMTATSGHWFYNCGSAKASCSIHPPWYNGHSDMQIGWHPDNGSPVAWHTWGSGYSMFYGGAIELANWDRSSGPNVMWIRTPDSAD